MKSLQINTHYIKHSAIDTCIGHYDKEKYQEQMDKYKKDDIKTRPNGRRWCHLTYSDLLSIRIDDDIYKDIIKQLVSLYRIGYSELRIELLYNAQNILLQRGWHKDLIHDKITRDIETTPKYNVT